jgi:signal transduction histidine kinase
VTRELLQRAGIVCHVCQSTAELSEEIARGAGAVVLTDAALTGFDLEKVFAQLARQPAWSDLPIVLLCQTGTQSPLAMRMIGAFTNLTLLDRPTSARSFLSTVQAAIRSRLRQYQTRNQLEALRQAEESLRTRERQLHDADRRKDEFLAMLAHELRNPMAPIRNASELLARTIPEDPEMQATVGIIKRQIAHLARLVDDLLDVSRITQGRIELQRRPLDLAEVVAQAMESVEPLMRERKHKVFVAASYEPLYVDGDAARLVQCLSNILTNSAKYTDPGGEIRLEQRAEGGFAVLSITDTGVGIPQELLPQIFDLFVQSDRSLDRSLGGLGIGLSVVQRLVEMHGGTVSASSPGPGRGARFEVRLPRVAAPAPARSQPQAAPPRALRILVVDDNADAADSLTLLLKLDGHQTQSVHTPSAALECAQRFEPEVILLDIGLPGMDGYEVARRIRARGSRARLIALTGYGQSEDVQRAREAGFDEHLVKPADPQELRRKLVGADVSGA